MIHQNVFTQTPYALLNSQKNSIGHHHVLMLCLNLMLEPTYLPYFCGMKKEKHMYSFRPIIY